MKVTLSTANPKDWYIFWVNEQGKVIKKRLGMNRIKSIPERREYGKQLVVQMNRVLKDGLAIIDPPAMKVLRDIVDAKKSGLRYRSWQSYHYALNVFERWLTDREMKMYEIDKPLARAFIDSLLKSGQKGKSVNGIRGFLGSIFNYYCDRNEGYLNPFRGIKKAELQAGKNIAFNDEQKEQIWSHLDAQLRLFTRFIYFTYLRPLELLRLQVRDVRPDMGVIIIQGHQSKNKRQQAVDIPDVFKEEIAGIQLHTLPGEWFLFGRGLKPGPVSYGRNSVTKHHRLVLTELKFSTDYTLYSWKHTGVVNAYRNKVPIYEIMRQLRHHSLDMTQIYLKSLGLDRNIQFSTLMR